MEQWVTVMSDFGFPVVVTLYLLHRIESKLESLNQSINNLPNQLKS
ncbi:YvrJ family protein [Alkalihalobacillus sp. TS-13]|nr:YvrJ family protein [Alkalihalobacillus sp. TS-13]